jgi:hypothetical protein
VSKLGVADREVEHDAGNSPKRRTISSVETSDEP